MSSSLKLNLILLLLIVLADNLQAADKPDQVIELFRHGARSPIFKYDLSWPQSEGILTTVGMLQHYELGKKLAERYPHLVESGYNPDDVYVLSNFVPRCIESALAHVSSMFRGKTSTLGAENPQKDQQENIIQRITPYLSPDEADRGEFVPIKVDVVSGQEQEFIFNGRNQHWCPVIGKYRQENEQSAEMAQSWNIFGDPINKANSLLPSRQHITNMAILNHAFDAFIVNLYDNKTLPGNINDMMLIESFNYGQAYYHELLEHLQPVQKGLTSFPTLNAMVEQLKNFREGKSPKKLALFSGHDLNILAILSAFGIISTECLLANYQDYIQGKPLSFPNCQYPKFASNLIFEFYNDTSNPYVKFYYNDVLISLCDGQESCSYDEFLSFINNAGKSQTLEIWTETCNGKTIIQEEEEKSPNQNSETQDKQENETTESQENQNDKTEESRENGNSETKKTESDNQKSEDKNSNQENKENEGSKPEPEGEDQTTESQDKNYDNKETHENTDPEPKDGNPNQENQTTDSQDKNSDQDTEVKDKNSDPEPQDEKSSSNQEKKNTDFDPQTGETRSIKTIESYGGVNKWLIVGASVMAALALTVTLRTCIKYKWWNPFRRFKKDEMFKQHDEIEV